MGVFLHNDRCVSTAENATDEPALALIALKPKDFINSPFPMAKWDDKIPDQIIGYESEVCEVVTGSPAVGAAVLIRLMYPLQLKPFPSRLTEQRGRLPA